MRSGARATRTGFFMAGIVAAAALLTAGGAAAAGSGCSNNAGGSLRQCIIGSGAASGQRLASAKGRALRPRSIFVYIYTGRPQIVHGEWTMTCKHTPGSLEGFKGRTFVTSTSSPGNPQMNPLNRRGYWGRTVTLRMPFRHPYSCKVQVSAGLSVAGSISVYILAIKR
jgi:hypothetical protein